MQDLTDVIEEIKIRSDIFSIISEYVQLKPSGSNYKGLCPFHHEKTPSFHVNTSKQIFKCFGCGEGGDVISFIMKIENLDFMDSIKFLAKKCGVVVNTDMDEQTRKRLEQIKNYQQMHVEAARFFYRNLMMKNNGGYDYLVKRGLDEKTIKNFGLGFSPDSWESLKNHMLRLGYTEEELYQAGLLSKNKEKNRYYDKFRNRVMFPIFDYKGNVIAFGGRVMDDSLPKYLNSPDSQIFNKRYNLYGLNFARKHVSHEGSILLVEGYMDLVSLCQFGIRNVVATLGTALTDNQAVLLKKFVKEVIISYDSDDAGVNAAIRAINVLKKQGLTVRVLDLGEFKDPDEYIRTKGVGSMLERIDKAEDSTIFRFNVLKRKFDLNDTDKKRIFLKEAVKIIKNINSALDLNYYMDYLSKITGVDISVIKSEYEGVNTGVISRKKYVAANSYISKERPKVVEDVNRLVELNLLKVMMVSEHARNLVPLYIDAEDFSDENCRNIYSLINEAGKKGIITTNDIYNDSLDREYIKKLDATDVSNINTEDTQEIEKIIHQFERNINEKKIIELQKEQAMIEEKRRLLDSNSAEAKELDMKVIDIARKILDLNKKRMSLK